MVTLFCIVPSIQKHDPEDFFGSYRNQITLPAFASSGEPFLVPSMNLGTASSSPGFFSLLVECFPFLENILSQDGILPISCLSTLVNFKKLCYSLDLGFSLNLSSITNSPNQTEISKPCYGLRCSFSLKPLLWALMIFVRLLNF